MRPYSKMRILTTVQQKPHNNKQAETGVESQDKVNNSNDSVAYGRQEVEEYIEEEQVDALCSSLHRFQDRTRFSGQVPAKREGMQVPEEPGLKPKLYQTTAGRIKTFVVH